MGDTLITALTVAWLATLLGAIAAWLMLLPTIGLLWVMGALS